jgi:hypothetical protein
VNLLNEVISHASLNPARQPRTTVTRHDHPTLRLAPTVCDDPLNDTGALPVEYRTLAVQTAPGELNAYSVGYEP